MLKFESEGQFRRDVKRVQKRGLDMKLLTAVVDTLLAQEPLPAACRDHALTGAYSKARECHVQPDWLLVYRIDDRRNTLIAVRTGSHSDMFD
jgi:mRNA interferase YafQ